MYNVKEVLNKEPAAVKAALVATATAVIFTGDFDLDGETVAAWGLAVEVLLGLFYVRAKVTPTAKLDPPPK